MDGTRFLSLTLLVVLLTACSPPTQGKLFVIKDKETSQPCVLVDVDFTVDLQAVQGQKVIATAQISSEDEGIRVSGSCGVISGVLDLFFPNSANWLLKFRQDKSEQAYLNRIVQFIPQKLFGETVPITEYLLMDDAGETDLGDATYSYKCPVPETIEYQMVTTISNKTQFIATANIRNFQAQAFNVLDGNFSDAVLCKAALTTQAPSPTSAATTEDTTTPEVLNTTVAVKTTTEMIDTTQETSLEPTQKPTSSPKPTVKLYTVKDGNITCIALQAALTLNIKYPVEGKGKTKTAKLFVPNDSTSSGNCKLSASSQELSISFFNNWELNIIFNTMKKNFLESLTSSTNKKTPEHPKYKISRIELIAYADEEKFPGTTWPADTKLNFANEKLKFPQVCSNKGFYKCDSTLKTKLTSTATVESQKLEMKAFNTDDNSDFSGSAAQCAADSGGSRKRTYVIVGCVLAAIVVLCFIVFVVMRIIRKRRENYHTLQ